MQTAETLRALAHRSRLELVLALASAARSVGELEQLTGIEQPALSQQLAILRKARLVLTQRKGKHVFYRVDPTGLAGVVALLGELVGPVARAEPSGTQSPSSAAAFARVTSRDVA